MGSSLISPLALRLQAITFIFCCGPRCRGLELISSFPGTSPATHFLHWKILLIGNTGKEFYKFWNAVIFWNWLHLSSLLLSQYLKEALSFKVFEDNLYGFFFFCIFAFSQTHLGKMSMWWLLIFPFLPSRYRTFPPLLLAHTPRWGPFFFRIKS